ncbi:MAG: hypothetical protein RBT69_02290 [Spirochaetia bacterium]|jgi:hypothetical protein|nr:hypothetical protein [Spirochaetia bacterium]
MLLSFLAIFFLPVSVLGWEFISSFWGENWIFLLIFIALIIALNVFFLANWSILKYVEKGDWSSLIPLLEKRVYKSNFITYSNIRLLVHSYLLQNSTENLFKLENHVKDKRKKLYRKTFLMFSSGHLLTEKPEELEKYFEDAYRDKSFKGKEWIAVNYVLALVIANKYDDALEVLAEIDDKNSSVVLRLCRIYFTFLCSPPDGRDKIIKEKEDFIAEIDAIKFEAELDKEKGDIHVLFLSKIIEQSKEWAYSL